jgi:hypothetical protein
MPLQNASPVCLQQCAVTRLYLAHFYSLYAASVVSFSVCLVIYALQSFLGFPAFSTFFFSCLVLLFHYLFSLFSFVYPFSISILFFKFLLLYFVAVQIKHKNSTNLDEVKNVLKAVNCTCKQILCVSHRAL